MRSVPSRSSKRGLDLTNPGTAKNYSAVAHFFARELRLTQKMPIFVLHASWGGTIVTWMSLDSLRQAPPIVKTLGDWDEALARRTAVKEQPNLMSD